ncbi:MAG: ComEA family DNA-binding protein [Chloroflexi bacterium]|nr:ComEA family DNA-binding protein [Chloroflexota bacterium]
MKNWWVYLLLGILGGLLGAGLLILVFSPPRGEPVRLLPAPTQALLVVHVDGAVANPGVYTLEPGSRIRDAVEAAGGLSPDASAERINMAAFLDDGIRIVVPHFATPQPTNLDGSPADEPTVAPTFPININTASLDELQVLPGIGPVKAQRIIDYRDENGRFESIDELLNVTGIGPATFEQFKDLITVDEF